MLLLLFLLLLAVPVAELYLIVQVSQGIGFLNTIALLILISMAGAWLLKQQGLQTWRRLNIMLAQGEPPAKELVDGALILLGGALLLTPGFLTDAVGLVFLLPPTRVALKGAARRVLGRWARRRFVPGGTWVYETTVVRGVRDDVSRSRPESRPEGSLPRPEESHPSGEDDSPDRG